MLIFLGIFIEFAVWVTIGTIIAKSFSKKRSVRQSRKSINIPRNDCECGESHNISKNEYTYCDFCGAKIQNATKKCPSCKAKLDK